MSSSAHKPDRIHRSDLLFPKECLPHRLAHFVRCNAKSLSFFIKESLGSTRLNEKKQPTTSAEAEKDLLFVPGRTELALSVQREVGEKELLSFFFRLRSSV